MFRVELLEVHCGIYNNRPRTHKRLKKNLGYFYLIISNIYVNQDRIFSFFDFNLNFSFSFYFSLLHNLIYIICLLSFLLNSIDCNKLVFLPLSLLKTPVMVTKSKAFQQLWTLRTFITFTVSTTINVFLFLLVQYV